MSQPSVLPPLFPTPPGTQGAEGGQGLLKRALKDLEDCGVNITLLNKTAIAAMDGTERLLFLDRLTVENNCSSGSAPPSWSSPAPGFPTSPDIVLVTFYVTVMVLGLLVNICVIGTICRVRKLRTITNCFVLSLALADLLMAAVVVPLLIKDLYSHKGTTTTSKQWAPLDTMFPILGVASLLNLCAVTMDRYFTITNPLTYEARVNSVQVGIIIASIWLISTAQELIHFAVPESHETLFQTIRFVIFFSIPFICVIFVNTKIYCIARGHARQIRANLPNQNDSNGRSFSRKMKSAQVIGLLVGTFMLTWLPYFVVTVIEEQDKPNHTKALVIAKTVFQSLACSTALFNPLLYGFLRKEVRTGIVRGLKCQNVNQSDLQTTATTTAELPTRRLEITRK